MSDELEILEAASVSALASDKTGDGYLNGPCPNCSTEIIGNFCFNCGQSARDLKRPFFSLIRDMLGDLFSFDGRVWKTIPSLMFRPGKVTRSYIDGQRMRFVPPFRLFLIASVLFFLVLFGITQKQSWAQGKDLNFNFGSEFIGTVIIDNKPIAEYEGFDQLFKDNEFNRVAAESFIDKLITENVIDETELNRDALLDKIEAMNGESLNRKELLLVIQKWVPRLSFLLLPSYVLTLFIMHAWIRRIYLYDHVIVALHLQSFFYLFATAGMLLSMVHPGIIWGVFGLSTYVYPFLLMRKVYDTHWVFNIIRVIGLHISTLFTSLGLIMLVFFVGADDLGIVSWSEFGATFSEFQKGFNEGARGEE